MFSNEQIEKVDRPCNWPPPPPLTPDEARRIDDEIGMDSIMLARDAAEILQRARFHVTHRDYRGWSDWFAWGILQKAEEFERLINPPRVAPMRLPWD